MKKTVILFTSLFFFSLFIYSENIAISGIDSSNLLFNGTISLYLNITDNEGETLTGISPKDLLIKESMDGTNYSDVEITSLSEGSNEDKGISFLLLVDNSGSMYDRINGEETDNFEQTRLSASVKAINSLIQSMQGSRDRAGLALFNTYYRVLSPVGSNRNKVLESLQMIEEPGKDESFTELNAAVVSASRSFARERGRKIIIVLSDGENYPFSPVRGEESPQFGASLYNQEQMIQNLKQNSTTLYGINFGTEKDKKLEEVVIASGGYLFEAGTEEELESVYRSIRERVLSEYFVEYRTGTEYAERKFVKVESRSSAAQSQPVFYFSGTLFGRPSENFNWVYFTALILVVLLMVLLFRLKQSSPAEKAGLEVKDYTGATQMFSVDSQKTVIGSNESDDVTVVNNQEADQSEATIIFDEKKSAYTVVSEKEVMVNNNPVKTRILEPGDVININGATIIFNDKD
jgi:Ca-activated chloride channel family protein